MALAVHSCTKMAGDVRAAMLKRRFSNIILKAQHNRLFDNGCVTKSAKIIKEASRKRQFGEENVRTLSKRQRQLREKERKAARIRLENMESAVRVEQNMQSIKELETLAGCSLYFFVDRSQAESKVIMGAFKGIRFWNPLEKIGLRFKDDDYYDDDFDHPLIPKVEDEVEEGEIVS